MEPFDFKQRDLSQNWPLAAGNLFSPSLFSLILGKQMGSALLLNCPFSTDFLVTALW